MTKGGDVGASPKIARELFMSALPNINGEEKQTLQDTAELDIPLLYLAQQYPEGFASLLNEQRRHEQPSEQFDLSSGIHIY